MLRRHLFELARNEAAPPALRRKISWNPKADNRYQQSREGLVSELASEFYWVEKSEIQGLVRGIEEKPSKWSPYQAYLGIKKYLRVNRPMPPTEVDLGSSTITTEEAQWYFLSNFKTIMEAVVDDSWVFKFVNTPDDNHAEDNMMQRLDEFIHENGWDEDFSESHTLLIRINNSPCRRCARRIYDWDRRDIFDQLTVQFANLYEKTTGFTEATATLRSGGVIMSLFSVIGDLIPLVDKENTLKQQALSQRKEKDTQESVDWKKWLEEH